MIGGCSDEEIVNEIEKTFYQDTFDFTKHFPGHAVRKEKDMLVFATGVPADVLNGVLGPRLDRHTLDHRIADVMTYFRKQRLPMTWFLGPSSGPEELESALADSGLVPGTPIPGMAIDLGALSPATLPQGVRVDEVSDMAALKVCSRTAANGFQMPLEAADGYMNFVESYGFGTDRRWFLGFLDDVAASVALVVLHERVASVYCVATLPEMRGRGLGKAVTRAALLAAKEAGYGVAVLEASDMGLPIYSKLGFRELCKLRTMTWHP
jgi:ribosomal protein S18 acetylase RimI-like enzyme